MKRVVFVGGIHGAGKSTLCRLIEQGYPCLLRKQRHVVMEVAKLYGLKTWEEAGANHHDLIEEVANRLVSELSTSPQSLLLLDTHFAISSTKALRLNKHPCDERYIYDLDPILVQELSQRFDPTFVLIHARIDTVIHRLLARDGVLEISYQDPILLEEQARYEERYAYELARIAGKRVDEVLHIHNQHAMQIQNVYRRMVSQLRLS